MHVPTGTPVTVLPAPAQTDRSTRPGLRRDVSAYRGVLPPGLLHEFSSTDVVLVQEYEEPRSDVLAWWGRMRGVPVFASFQGGIPPWTAAPVQRLVRGTSLRRLSGVLVGSQPEDDRLVHSRGVAPARVHRVVNPVNVDAWSPSDRAPARRRLDLPSSAFVVAWHGRVDLCRKGLDVLLDAWKSVCAQRPHADLLLLLVGAGPDEAALRSLLLDRGVRGVEWLAEYAPAASVRERLAACDLWVSASRHEGFAVAPLEAMATGRAVLVSDAPGAEDLLGSTGEWGGTAVPRGSATALASALLDALVHRTSLDGRGRAARRRVEDGFSTAAVSRQLIAALQLGSTGTSTCR